MIVSRGISTVSSLEVDNTNAKLFWLDRLAGTLNSVNFDGTGLITWNSNVFGVSSTFVLFKVRLGRIQLDVQS